MKVERTTREEYLNAKFDFDPTTWAVYGHLVCLICAASNNAIKLSSSVASDLTLLINFLWPLYFRLLISMYLWSPCVIGQTIIFLPCGFYLSSFFFFFFFFPCLISAIGDWIRTRATWCGPRANLECMSEMCFTRLAENTGRKKSPFWHHRTTLSGCIFEAEKRIDNRKKTY